MMWRSWLPTTSRRQYFFDLCLLLVSLPCSLQTILLLLFWAQGCQWCQIVGVAHALGGHPSKSTAHTVLFYQH